MKTIVAVLFSALLMAAPVFSADVKEYIDGPTGVTVKLNDDGTMKSIVASGEAELTFGDRKDERMAMQKAVLRAKANISKFMSERLSSEEVMEGLSKTASNATADSNNPTQSTSVRETLETQREVIRNSSEAILKGLVTLASETNREGKYVKVVMGTNEKILKAADNLGAKMKQNLADPVGGAGAGNDRMTNESGTPQGGREIRASDALKDF